jgi:hypothetical protein
MSADFHLGANDYFVPCPGKQIAYSYQRLAQIKAVYDPHNLSVNPQSITKSVINIWQFSLIN